MQHTTRLKLSQLNDHLICVLCGGYLVDATSITECLHSFCRTCIVRHLHTSKSCPKCNLQVHKTKPLLNLRPDRTLQTLVYKLVPGLYQNEMQKRREFYSSHAHAVPTSGEDAGTMEDNHVILTEDEKISLCLQHCERFPPNKNGKTAAVVQSDSGHKGEQRHLLCPALLTIGHLKKFVKHKFDLPKHYQVEIFHSEESLKDVCTVMDIANIYSWKRMEPLKLYYIVFDKTQLSLDLPDPIETPIITTTVRLTTATGKKRGRKRKTSGSKASDSKASDSKASDNIPLSPKNGLVKTRLFKPPSEKRAKHKKKKSKSTKSEEKPEEQSTASDVTVGDSSTSVPVPADAVKSSVIESDDDQPLAVLKETSQDVVDSHENEEKAPADPASPISNSQEKEDSIVRVTFDEFKSSLNIPSVIRVKTVKVRTNLKKKKVPTATLR